MSNREGKGSNPAPAGGWRRSNGLASPPPGRVRTTPFASLNLSPLLACLTRPRYSTPLNDRARPADDLAAQTLLAPGHPPGTLFRVCTPVTAGSTASSCSCAFPQHNPQAPQGLSTGHPQSQGPARASTLTLADVLADVGQAAARPRGRHGGAVALHLGQGRAAGQDRILPQVDAHLRAAGNLIGLGQQRVRLPGRRVPSLPPPARGSSKLTFVGVRFTGRRVPSLPPPARGRSGSPFHRGQINRTPGTLPTTAWLGARQAGVRPRVGRAHARGSRGRPCHRVYPKATGVWSHRATGSSALLAKAVAGGVCAPTHTSMQHLQAAASVPADT